MKTLIKYLVVPIIILSCNSPTEKGKVGDPVYLPPDIKDSTQITEENVLRATYSSYKYPESFNHEEFIGASPYYENTISIHRDKERPNYWKELSTNERNQALAWSESSSVYSAYYRKIVSERETEKYFEFRREWEAHPTDAILSRIHKSSYLDRSMYDRMNPTAAIAVFKSLPIDTAKVKELIEYLWYADNYNFGGAKVLCSYVVDRGTNIEYLLFHTEVSYGDWGLRDQIGVYRSSFSVAKGTGTVVFKKYLILSVIGKLN